MARDLNIFRWYALLILLLFLATLNACAGVRPYGQSQEWTLIFDGFSLDEMVEMEGDLEGFYGYAGHRPGNGIKTNRHHEYWYRSSINSAKMEQNLSKLLRKFNHEGRIYMSGLTVEVRKAPKPVQAIPSGNEGW